MNSNEKVQLNTDYLGDGQPCYLYGADFGSPYCPIQFEAMP